MLVGCDARAVLQDSVVDLLLVLLSREVVETQLDHVVPVQVKGELEDTVEVLARREPLWQEALGNEL